MPTMHLYGGDLYYEIHGHGPALIFVHGRGGNHASWWQQVPRFCDRYTCIAYDAPGFGRSDHPDGDWTFVDTLAALIERLGLSDVRLVAQSMGGIACLSYALRSPERVRALVMASTTGSLELPEFDAIWEAHQPRWEEASRHGIITACGERMLHEQPAKYLLYQEIASFNRITWSVEHPLGGARHVPSISREALQQLQVSTLYVIGDEDLGCPPATLELAATVTPGGRVVRVSEAGHSVYFERPDQFNALVDAFLIEVATA